MITVIENQSLLDIAVQYYGNALAAFDLAVVNKISITDVLVPGQQLIKPTSEFNNIDVSKYFEARNQMIATAISITQKTKQQFGFPYGFPLSF